MLVAEPSVAEPFVADASCVEGTSSVARDMPSVAEQQVVGGEPSDAEPSDAEPFVAEPFVADASCGMETSSVVGVLLDEWGMVAVSFVTYRLTFVSLVE